MAGFQSMTMQSAQIMPSFDTEKYSDKASVSFQDCLNVLVVDDQMAMRSILKKMLYAMPRAVNVLEASDGEEGWEKINANEQLGLVISDVKMPRLDGTALLKRCRMYRQFRNLPFLLMSGHGLSEIVAYAGEWGAYEYLLKPFSEEQFMERLYAVLERVRSPEQSIAWMVERLRDQGKLDKAIERVESAAKLFPHLKAKWLNLRGECLMETGDYGDAIECMEKALAECDTYLAPYKNLSAIHLKLGDLNSAINALQQVDCISPLDLDRKMELGKMLVDAERHDEAKTFFEKVLKQALPEERYDYSMKIADIYLNVEQFAEAEAIYVSILNEKPGAVEALNRLGIAFRRQGKFQEAETYYLIAIRTFPNIPAIYYNLAILYMDQRYKAKASKILKKALQIDPGFTPAQKMLDSIELDL